MISRSEQSRAGGPAAAQPLRAGCMQQMQVSKSEVSESARQLKRGCIPVSFLSEVTRMAMILCIRLKIGYCAIIPPLTTSTGRAQTVLSAGATTALRYVGKSNTRMTLQGRRRQTPHHCACPLRLRPAARFPCSPLPYGCLRRTLDQCLVVDHALVVAAAVRDGRQRDLLVHSAGAALRVHA